uniref:alpha-E domain-containing protein n=1 Tax=uncultured Caulobacter sp. TaxID=158749 RepID=UPI0025E3162E|nr:alpha-E domain-containing protein [uncultured Caulobacter sp.]
MMLARVADSLYWLGRYIERAEHLSRLSSVMLNATLDQTDGAQAVWIAMAAVGEPGDGTDVSSFDAAQALVLDRGDPNSVVSSLARARENARQVRDQITTETWERLNLLYLKVTDAKAGKEFSDGSAIFLHDVIADLHLFKGAADTTMSHGESWRFMMLGIYMERAQLVSRLLEVCFAESPTHGQVDDHVALVSVLRMACALEPYLRVYTAEIEPRHILEFLVFDEDFPRSIRFATAQIEQHLSAMARAGGGERAAPERLAGRLKARLQFADVDELEAVGAGPLLTTVVNECARIHEAIYETFVAYPLEMRLPA